MCGILFVEGPIDATVFEVHFNKLKHRGPDQQQQAVTKRGTFGFHRLSIMDLSEAGMQPFQRDGITLVCNGEIYNYKSLKEQLFSYKFQSSSDCECLIPLYKNFCQAMLHQLDGEFVFILYDEHADRLFVARDPLGIRPLFYGKQENGAMAFASEAKALIGLCKQIFPFPIGTYYDNGQWIQYHDVTKENIHSFSLSQHMQKIKQTLISATIKRLDSDAPFGFLLSGGLDSSLVCAIASQHLQQPIKTFAIGMRDDPIDLKYAATVAMHLQSDHQEVLMEPSYVIDAVKDVIYHLETYDVTTVRASIGMYLLTKAILQQTNIKVLLTGEVSDELFGYKYTDFAPNAKEFNKESQKRLKELYAYDVLRADRCIAAWSIEARVPFSDSEFIKSVMEIDPMHKLNSYGIGKYLLRQAFVDEPDLLPSSILWREKAAFSDAVGHSMVDHLKAHAQQLFSDLEFEQIKGNYTPTPISKEALWYRQIFDEFYPDQAHLIPGYWMPNPNWVGSSINDPSARYLSNYHDSGK